MGSRLTLEDAVKLMVRAESIFEEKPTKRVVKTDLFTINRGAVVRDVLMHTVDGARYQYGNKSEKIP